MQYARERPNAREKRHKGVMLHMADAGSALVECDVFSSDQGMLRTMFVSTSIARDPVSQLPSILTMIIALSGKVSNLSN